ncbi:MAG TPA: SRPBCC family protein [Candidatus Polarisedimenticolia bacterium]|jgi:effector-binding domain-containing protein|nr:SRPBCC family protein [Candidatus Polarisedimenticolia bacterium]
MRLAKKAVLLFLVLAALFVGVGLLLPRQVHVERSAVIGARPATVHLLLTSFRHADKWLPCYDLDPQAKYTMSGPDFGVGATFHWTSENRMVGSGSQTVVESRPPDYVKRTIDFGTMGTSEETFHLTPEGEGTRVVWGVDSDMGAGPTGRWFGLAMDSLAGKDFEKALANLDRFAATLPREDLGDLVVSRVEVQPVTIAYVPATAGHDEAAYAAALGAGFGQVARFMSKHGVRQVAPVLAINNKEDAEGYQFDAAIPLDRAPDKPVGGDSNVQVKQTYGGPALKVVHKGSYHGLPATWAKTIAFMKTAGYEPAGAAWDEFVSDPGNTLESERITNIYVPIR